MLSRIRAQAVELDDLFDFDQDDVEFDETELEQVGWRVFSLFLHDSFESCALTVSCVSVV